MIPKDQNISLEREVEKGMEQHSLEILRQWPYRAKTHTPTRCLRALPERLQPLMKVRKCRRTFG